MNLKVEHFEDVHLHAASVHDWEQTYSQLSPGLVAVEGRDGVAARLR